MDVGVIKQVGTPEELYFHPKNLFVAGFIGDPPMNFIKGKVNGGVFESTDGFYHFDLSYFTDEQKSKVEGKNITLGYRPESAVVGEEITNPEQYLEMKGVIEVYEMLGDLQNVYLTVGTEQAIIKAKPEIKIEIGADMTYYVKKSDFRFFDSDTEDAIELEETGESK
jgi:multiple sugar transport system ATP-binding protein